MLRAMATPEIEDRLKDLLDETRLVMLGTQLLFGLHYQAAFSKAFYDLPAPFAAPYDDCSQKIDIGPGATRGWRGCSV
jgi:hypothetical protein